MKLNGQTINWTREECYSLCQCGHYKMSHVHFNGGLDISEGTPTYCGFDNCHCGQFKDRVYQTTEGDKKTFERNFERIINLFVTIEINFGYILPSDFSDEFISAVKNARDYCLQQIEINEDGD